MNARTQGTALRNQASARIVVAAAWLYLGFVVYGSLVPFHFYDLTPAAAWSHFVQIRYLNLDMAARADWIANLVLYVPLGFLLRAALGASGEPRNDTARRGASLLAVALCLITAIAVEFLQVYAPARTVSLNDLMAEAVGGLAGVAAFHLFGARLFELLHRTTIGGGSTIRAAALLYAAAYLVLSLFPFDFVFTGAELAAKLATGESYGLLVANGCVPFARCFAKLAAEVIAALPLGILLGLQARRGSKVGLTGALLFGLVLGTAIEGAQLLLVSGVSQGMSVFTRASGVALGFAATHSFDAASLVAGRRYARGLLVLGAPFYVLMLAMVNGLFSGSWRGLHDAAAELAQVHWMPFYYHYYTSEAAAFVSLLAVGAMYAPIGFGYWIWRWAGGAPRYFSLTPGVWAAGLALVMEIGKLFVQSRRPDPSDLLIAFGAGLIAFVSLNVLTGRTWARATGAHRIQTATGVSAAGSPVRWFVLIPAAAFLSWAALHWPIAPVPVLLGLLGYGAVLWVRPGWWAWALPLLLPILNFSVWSGQLFFDEFDLILLVTLVVAGLRTPCVNALVARDPIWTLVLSLLTLSYGIALLRGIWPLEPLDINAFSSYFSHLNALRGAKGFVWALALVWLMRRWWILQPAEWEPRWNAGLTFGLLAFACAVVWERYLFPGVFDFTEHYRVSGTFATLHTGGPQVETYAVLSLPLAVVWAWQLRSKWGVPALAAVVSLGVYTVWVSYSRAGYLGVAVAAMVLLVLGILRNLRSDRIRRAVTAGLAAVILGIGTLLAAGGGYLHERFQRSHTDLDRRLDHWQAALGLMPPGWSAALFGAGLGSFPAAYLLRNPQGDLPGNYRYVQEADNRYLRLGSGDTLYFGQHIAVQAQHRYRLDFDVRASGAGVLGIHLCEKFITQSYGCRNLHWTADRAGQWQHVRMTIETGALPASDGRKRPVEFAFSATGRSVVFDLDNIKLGRPNLIHNGDFSRAWERWFFTTDDLRPWRVENVWLQFYFEQGWFGVVIFGILLLVHIRRLFAAAWAGDLISLGLLASIAGWLTIATFSSVLDDPKLALWFYLLVFYGQIRLLSPRASQRVDASQAAR